MHPVVLKKDDLDASRDLTGEEVPRMAIQGPPWMTATQLQAAIRPKRCRLGALEEVSLISRLSHQEEKIYMGGGRARGRSK